MSKHFEIKLTVNAPSVDQLIQVIEQVATDLAEVEDRAYAGELQLPHSFRKRDDDGVYVQGLLNHQALEGHQPLEGQMVLLDVTRTGGY